MNKICLMLCALYCSNVMGADLYQSITELNRMDLAVTESSAVSGKINLSVLQSERIEFGLHLPGGGYEMLVHESTKQHSKNKFSWFGYVKGFPDSSVNFSVVNGFIAGSIQTEKETFEFSSKEKNQLRIAQLVTHQFAGCEAEVEPIHGQFDVVSLPETVSGSTAMIDVMVIYTPQARDAAGGEDGIEATAQAAVDAMNLSFDNSNVDAEAALSYTGVVNYNDTGDSSDDLGWVSSDPYVAQLRTAYGADMVSLLVNSMSGCGRGYVMRSPGSGFAGAAFQVTRRSCAVGNLSFAHEFGHNMGLEHNPENASVGSDDASNPWSFGHYHDNTYRTVMSYSNQCDNGCSRRQYYSNPDMQYLGLDTGITDARDNARTLRQTAAIVAAFRPEANDTIFEDGFDG